MTIPTWTATLCAIYAATGDLLQAMACVGIQPHEFYAIWDSVPAFAARIAAARREAHRTAAQIMLAEALGPRNPELVPGVVQAALGDGELSDGDFLRLMQHTVRRIREEMA